MENVLRDLHAQCGQKKVEEGIDFSIAYLKQMESCQHVIGVNYRYVLESVHNRKSFVYNLLHALEGFEADMEVTSSEIHLIIESICPDFPRSLLTDAVLTATDQYSLNSLRSERKFPITDLGRAVICHILYDEWIKAIEEYFRMEGKGYVLSITKIRGRCEQCYYNLPLALPQPPLAALHLVLDEAARQGADISFEQFKKATFGSSAVQCELRLLANYPQQLASI
eukprot:gene91-99_t